MVYRGMDIGSAKPDAATQARCRYHLLDLCAPQQPYSAAQFVVDCRAAIAQIQARGRIPVLVGGTNLYFRALRQGLSDLPPTDPQLRLKLQARLMAEGLPALHAELCRVDPITGARLHVNDTQRTMRALEIFYASGQAMSANRSAWTAPVPVNPSELYFALYPEHRAALHARIAERFMQMLDQGFEAEVARLRAQPGLSAQHSSMKAIGYQQFWQFMDGALTQDQAIEQAIAGTRQLAKRQITWIRSETHWTRLDVAPAAAAGLSAVAAAIRKFF